MAAGPDPGGPSGGEAGAVVEAYARAFEGLTPETIDQLVALVDNNVRFKDPFSDVRGVQPFRAVFTKMFQDTDAPRFQVRDIALSVRDTGPDTRRAYLRWDFDFRPKGSKDPWHITGMSEVHVGPDGRITAHIDHWDAGEQLVGRLPGLSWIWRLIARRLGSH